MAQDILLYALSTCIHCKRTKEFLDQLGIDYDVVYVDRLAGEERNQAIEEVKKFNPALSFPTLVAGQECIVGFKKDQIEKAVQGK
ncbi:MAG: glutaredoxin family protein [Desulfohalobiaceae bacterium]